MHFLISSRLFLPLKNSWHYAVPLNNVYSLYISYLHVWCCLLLPASCGTVLEGVGASLGSSWVMGEGLPRRHGWFPGKHSVWVSTICPPGVFLRLLSAVCSVFPTRSSFPTSKPSRVPCPPLLCSSYLPPFCLTVGPDQRPLLPRCPPHPAHPGLPQAVGVVVGRLLTLLPQICIAVPLVSRP